MKREGQQIVLDKADLIRMNQLVRRRTDLNGFTDWYQTLEVDEQASLVGALCHFAYQAGVDDSLFQEVVQESNLVQEQDFVALLKKVHGPSGLNISGFVGWLGRASTTDRSRALRFFACLFGQAERRVLQTENPRSCNHWWHRNLENPRVVESILNDPQYFKTSPRDDPPLD